MSTAGTRTCGDDARRKDRAPVQIVSFSLCCILVYHTPRQLNAHKPNCFSPFCNKTTTTKSWKLFRKIRRPKNYLAHTSLPALLQMLH